MLDRKKIIICLFCHCGSWFFYLFFFLFKIEYRWHHYIFASVVLLSSAFWAGCCVFQVAYQTRSRGVWLLYSLFIWALIPNCLSNMLYRSSKMLSCHYSNCLNNMEKHFSEVKLGYMYRFWICIGEEIILFREDERLSVGWIYDVWGCLAELGDVDFLGFGWTSCLVRQRKSEKEWENDGQRLIRVVDSEKKPRDSMSERESFK